MSAGKGNGSWANCSVLSLRDGDFSAGCCPHCALSLHTQMALLAKFAVGNQLSWPIEVMTQSLMECDFLSTQQLWPRLWQACLMAQVPLVPPCQHISTPSFCSAPGSGDCFPVNYLHKFSAAAGDKSPGTEQQHAPDLSHRRTNGGSSTRRAHKGAAPAGALTPLCHSYLLLCHNGPAAPAGPPGP